MEKTSTLNTDPQKSSGTPSNSKTLARCLRRLIIAVGVYAVLWGLTALVGSRMVLGQVQQEFSSLLSRPNAVKKLDTLSPMPFLIGVNMRVRWGSPDYDGSISLQGVKRRDYYAWPFVKPIMVYEDVLAQKDILNWMWRLTGKTTSTDDLLGF